MVILGARKAICDATALGWGVPLFGTPRVDHSGPVSNTGQIATLLQAAEVLRAVDSQPDPVKSWLYYCYSAQHRREDGDNVHESLMAALFGPGSPWLRVNRDNDMERLSRMVSLCMEDYRLRCRTSNADGGARKLEIQHIAMALSQSPVHWKRDWGAKWSAGQDVLADLDRRGVTSVSGLIDDLRITP